MIKQKYIDMVKTRVSIVTLASDLYPNLTLQRGGLNRKKCCCPFHEEKTPSMFLDSNLERYRCFGCNKGGDVISFVEEAEKLDFNEAVKYLLDNYCPEVNTRDLYEKMTPEEEETWNKAKILYEYNEIAYKFFRKEYDSDGENAIRCRAYTEATENGGGRWPKDYCKIIGLGYAPRNGQKFIDYIRAKGLKLNLFEELGLIGQEDDHPGVYYSKFRDRVMIPQRDKRNHIVTFTGRALSPHADRKYLNGCNSLIYQKNKTIFGIDVALKAAKTTGKVYLTEGAPNVMRLQSMGITNVIAPLGGVWSEQQLNEFKGFNCTLCFVPDADVPKQGKRFGNGIEFVFNNARLATELGFIVSVKEIPGNSEQNEDIDSYVKTVDDWNELAEKDFVLWYTEKHYDDKATQEEQLKVINDVCDILVHVQSETMQATLLGELKSQYKKGSIWKKALEEAAKRLQEQQRRIASKKNNDLAGYHFYRKGNHYYDIDSQGHEREWTNFIMTPLFLIHDDKKPTRIFELLNESGQKRTIELEQKDVTKLERFKEQIEGKGDFRFFERNEKYELLKAYLYAKTEEATRVLQMGWNNIGSKGFYAFCNGIVYHGGWQSVDEYGIIRMENENYYLPAMSKIHKTNRYSYLNERRYMHAPKREVTRNEFFYMIVDLYGDNGIIALCYYMASLFRDIIIDSTRSFPLLNIYGKKGTGKTEFAVTIMSLFLRNSEVSNLESTTDFAMGDKCSEICNGLVHFDEYKTTLSKRKIDFLKGIYDCAGRNRRANDSERRESTSIDCGVILTGQEMPTSPDSALFTRVLFLESQRSERTKEETDKYHKLIEMRNQYPTNITVGLVKYRENFQTRWSAAWLRALEELKEEIDYTRVQERFINNWAMILATAYTLLPFLDDIPFTEEAVHEICVKAIQYQQSLTTSTDEISMFWSTFSKARQIGEIKENQDYKISLVTSMKVSKRRGPAEVVTFDKPTFVLFIREKICLAKANIQAKREGKNPMPDESLLSYLTTTSEFYGKTKNPMKFYNYDENGNIVMHTNEDGGREKAYTQERVFAFNYEDICENYDIDLQTFTEKVWVERPSESNISNTSNTDNIDNTGNNDE